MMNKVVQIKTSSVDFNKLTSTPLLLASLVVQAGAATITVPNGSFESQVPPPTPPYITTQVDSWQKTARPIWFDEAANGMTWDQTAGLFQNAPSGSGYHDNMNGNQALYLLSFPQAGLFQDYNTTDWNHSTPTHDFNSLFHAGLSYQLVVGVIGGKGGMPEGAALELSLYYRDNANNIVTVGSSPITYTAAAFPNAGHFLDFTVSIPTVQSGDAWAEQNIGIGLFSTSGTGTGYWELDNVRLTEVPEPTSGALLGLGLGAFLLKRWRARPAA